MPEQQRNKVEIYDHVIDFKRACAGAGLIDIDGKIDLKFVFERLPELYEGWHFIPVDAKDMRKRCLGLTLPEAKRIELREDVYEGLCRGEEEHCFTGAHELGHMVLHGQLILARTETQRDSVSLATGYEREADDFAKLLLGYDSTATQRAIEVVALALSRWMPSRHDPKK